MRLLLHRYKETNLTSKALLTKNNSKKSVPVAISDLDLYQRFSTNPQIEGFVLDTPSSSLPPSPSALPLVEINGKNNFAPIIFDAVEPSFSPFEGDENPINDELFQFFEIIHEPTVEIKEGPNSASPDTSSENSGKGTILDFFSKLLVKKNNNPNYEIIVPICEIEQRQVPERSTKANFNFDVSVLMYDQREPLSTVTLRRTKSLKYRRKRKRLHFEAAAPAGISKSILKIKSTFTKRMKRSVQGKLIF